MFEYGETAGGCLFAGADVVEGGGGVHGDVAGVSPVYPVHSLTILEPATLNGLTTLDQSRPIVIDLRLIGAIDRQ